ncbi:MAG TPA: PD-(D/E)XK nuclease family protein [Actinophytocola sp.]|uniref:CRISPR-associated protein Cas4 n=1 Tax=Actinophytocola sp. TaxID=1872138 RepID=UPI002DBF809B|nr:PD-(D/E)XK nuclease family protein [Actinophytocola sp.]HEU5475667.1 PD-(D/E)XK nuclease family protein [Actinophytocola sp.]
MTAVDRPAERTTADLLLEWDRQRPRSRQRELGWSEVGGCRRRAGYRLAGAEPTNPGGSVQAVLGTAIHDAVQQRLVETAAPEDLVEYPVEFAGIPGHLDRYEAEHARLVDVKTTSSRWLDHIKVHGPERSHLWQTNGYAAALIGQGRPVREIVIDYIARDTGDLHRWTGRPDPLQVKAALEWIRAVRSVPVDMLNRDYAPDGPFCQHCPFFNRCWDGATPGRDPRSVLLVEDPDAAGWAAKLWQARQDIAAAKDREAEAKGALDALRPNEAGGSDVLDVGFELGLLWTITDSERLDTTQVRAEYARVGARPPTKTSTSTKLSFVPLPDGPAP